MKRESPAVQAWLTLVALALVWGSSYILIKKCLLSFEPWQVGHLRLAIAGLAFLPALLSRFKSIERSDIFWLLLVGLCGTGLPSFLFPIAQTQIPSSLAAALSSLTPLFTLVLSVIVFGGRLRLNQVFGILLGLLGAILLIGARYGWDSLVAGGWPLLYIGAAVLATLCYAISSNLVKAKFATRDPLLVTAGAMVPLGIFGAVGLLIGGGVPLQAPDMQVLLVSYTSVVFLALIGTALASWLFFRLVQLTEPVFASTVSYLVPMVAFGWGILDGELISLSIAAMLGIILLGVYLTRK